MEIMKEEKNGKLISKSRYSSMRFLHALDDGRYPGKNGRPQYLEKKELEILKMKILCETANNHSLLLREVSEMVFLLILYIFNCL
jgi:hypothetical protein